jgi:hypothetical protein
MANMKKLSIAVLAAALGFTSLPALRAQEAPSSTAPQKPGMSDHDGMMGNELRGMMKMMDGCSRMMQSMIDRGGTPSPDQPRETPSPR